MEEAAQVAELDHLIDEKRFFEQQGAQFALWKAQFMVKSARGCLQMLHERYQDAQIGHSVRR